MDVMNFVDEWSFFLSGPSYFVQTLFAIFSFWLNFSCMEIRFLDLFQYSGEINHLHLAESTSQRVRDIYLYCGKLPLPF